MTDLIFQVPLRRHIIKRPLALFAVEPRYNKGPFVRYNKFRYVGVRFHIFSSIVRISWEKLKQLFLLFLDRNDERLLIGI